MQERVLDTQEAPNKWWAMQDRRMRNIANKSLYTQAEQVIAIRMLMVLQLVYAGRFFDEPNYGKRGISVKVEKPTVIDRKNLRLLEADWEKQGVVKKVTPQGLNYFIPKG